MKKLDPEEQALLEAFDSGALTRSCKRRFRA